MPDIQIRPPSAEDEWLAYYALRWQILREPWNQPKGSERDELEQDAYHLAAFDNRKVVGTARLHFLSATEAQVRYMSVSKDYLRKGIGAALLKGLEQRAASRPIEKIVLNARQSAEAFYLKNGYQSLHREKTLYGEIHHTRMQKTIA